MIRILTTGLFCGLVLSLSAAAPEKYAPYAPPFAAAAGERRPATRIVHWKVAEILQGSSVALNLFANGEANLFSPDLKQRYGGLTVMFGTKALSGKRSPWEKDSCFFTYPDAAGLVQRFTLRPDGRIRIELDKPAGQEVFWNLSLIGEFFGGAAIRIDDRQFRLPPHDEKAQFYNRLYDGPAKRITFFPDVPEKTFSFEFPAGCQARLGSSGGHYGVALRLAPTAADAAKLEMILEPGTVEIGNVPAPQGYTLKAGAYDFWSVDRLRLPDRRGKNLLGNNSFEQGFASLWFPHGGGMFSRKLWDTKPIRVNDADAFAGSSSLEILSDDPKGELVQSVATHAVILTPGEYTLSFYAKSDRPGKQTLQLGAPELPPGANYWDPKTHVRRSFSLTGEWQRFSYTFRTQVARPQYFQLAAASSEPAVCRIDAMQLERGPEATAYAPAPAEGRLLTAAPDNFLEFGAKADAKLQITVAKPGEAGRVETVVRDFFGKEVRRFANPFAANQSGKAEVALNLEDMPRGIFTVENRYTFPDGRNSYEFTRFAVMSFLDNTHPHKSMFANAYIDPFGVHQYYPEVLDRYRKIGIGARAAFANTEKLVADEAAKYGVDTFSTMMLRGDANLVKGMPKPCYGMTVLNNIVWYESPSVDRRRVDYATITLPGATPEKLKEIEKASARKAAEAPWVKIWGAINEAEGWMPEFAHSRFASDENYRQYVELELAVARGVRAGNPKAMVGNSSTSCLFQDRVETLDKLLTTVGDRFRYDCFITHTYREAPEYPDLDKDFEALFAMLARHGYKDTPVYCPEGMHWKPYRMPGLIHVDWVDVPWGPFTYDMGHAERISTAWRARQWLIGLKHQDRVKLMNSSTNFWGFDMDCNLTPFADQKVPNTLGRLLGDAMFVREVRYSPKARCYLFEDGEKRPVAVLWSCAPEVDRGEKAGPEWIVPAKPDAQLFDLMEAEGAFPESGRLRLSPFPVFLRGKPGRTAEMVKLLENSELAFDGEAAAASRFTVIPPDRFAIAFTNGGRHVVAGTIELGGKKSELSLNPGENRSFTAALPAVLSSERLAFESLAAVFTQREPRPGKFTLRDEFSGVLARRAAITVDGSAEDWKGIPALEICQRLIDARGQVATGKSPEQDCSATLRIAWSAEKLYLAVEVTDDKLAVIPRGLPGQGWRNDSLQFFLDPFADGRNSGAPGPGPDDWSYGVYPEPDTLKPYVYRHRVPDYQLTEGFAGARVDTIDAETESAFRRTERGYFYEVALPKRALMPLVLKPGAQFGLGVMVNDQDSDAAMPHLRLVWGAQAFAYNDRPDLWPQVILAE